MTATHAIDPNTTSAQVLYVAFELGWSSWKLASTIGAGQKPRLRTVRPRDTDAVINEIRDAKRRFNLPPTTPVMSCYEAGRDGFWLHRFLASKKIENLIVDSASIEVNRRRRRAKSDNLDGTKLVGMLIRWHHGEKKLWGVVRVPSASDEDRRQLHRELIELKTERTEHVNRVKGLLAGLGLSIVVDADFVETIEKLRQWDGSGLPPGLKQRILREFERWQFVTLQIRELERQRTEQIRNPETPQGDQVRLLLKLKGIGENGAWLLVREFFGWRQIRNRRELASLAGLTPTPYSSGESQREQGISKAGNRRVRWIMSELAWCWLIHQPNSELSIWYHRRFAGKSSRLRKVGIIALARKLLIALWKYLETGELPPGAETIEKVKFRVTSTKKTKKTAS
jgi:transposase